MEGYPDIWVTFIRTAGMFFIVISLLVLILYLVKRFLGAGGNFKRGRDLIQVISMHHFSPREKVILLEVLDKRILIGVTPGRITTLASFDNISNDQLPGQLSGSSSEPLSDQSSAKRTSDVKPYSKSPSYVGAFSKILAGKKSLVFNEKQVNYPWDKAKKHEK